MMLRNAGAETRRTSTLVAAVLCTMIGCTRDSVISGTAPEELKEELRIASSETDSAYQFVEIRNIAASPRSIYVRQRGTQKISMFDSGGRFVRTIGRNGSGPGEFRELMNIGLVGDTLWTIDWGLRRFSRFDSSGALLSTVQFESSELSTEPGSALFVPYPESVLPDGTVLGFGGYFAHSLAEGRVLATPLLRMTAAGRTTDTIGWRSLLHGTLILQHAKAQMYMNQPFDDSPISVYAPALQRAYLIERWSATEGSTSEYQVTALRSNGDTAWVKQISYTPVEIERRTSDSVRAQLVRGLRPRFSEEVIDKALYIPRFRTPVSEVIAGEDGTLWLRREPGDSISYDVLDKDGALKSHVSVPARTRVLWVSGNTAWGVALDDDDVPSLVRYRVVGRM